MPPTRRRLRSALPHGLASGPAGPLLGLATLALAALGHSAYVDLLEPVGLGGAYGWVTGLGLVYALVAVGLAGLVAVGRWTGTTTVGTDSPSLAGGLVVAVFALVGHGLAWRFVPDRVLAVGPSYAIVPVAFAVTAGLARGLGSRTLVVAGFCLWTLGWFAGIPVFATVLVVIFAGAGVVAGLPVYLCARALRTD